MEFTAQSISDFLNGKIEGNPGVKVTNVSKIEEGKEGMLSFLANPKYEKYLYTTKSSIVLVNKDLKLNNKVNATLIRVENAYEAFGSLLDLYQQSKPSKKGIEEPAYIHQEAKIGKDVYIGVFSVISRNAVIGNNVKIYPNSFIGENARVGDNTIIYPGVKIYEDCIIGKNCTLHSGVVIGSDGFGFAHQDGNNYKKIPQVGNVVIEDDVEIGANTTIDRATMGSTFIRKGAKLDNLIQVAHNVEIGENTAIAAQAGISGSSKIGKNCIVAGQAGIVGHITIEDNVIIGAQAGVSNSIKNKGTIVLGSPATDIKTTKKAMVLSRKLPDMYDRLNQLEKELGELKNQK